MLSFDRSKLKSWWSCFNQTKKRSFVNSHHTGPFFQKWRDSLCRIRAARYFNWNFKKVKVIKGFYSFKNERCFNVFFIRNQFIRNWILKHAKIKKLLEPQNSCLFAIRNFFTQKITLILLISDFPKKIMFLTAKFP